MTSLDKDPRPTFDAERLTRETAATLDIPLDDELMIGVAANLERAARLAAVLDDVDFDTTDEPMPVYRP